MPGGVRRRSLPAAARPLRRPTDELAGTLARAVRGRSAGPVLQRAIIAIDGPSDDGDAKASTRSCLANLQIKHGADDVSGPDVLGNLTAPTLHAPDENIYVLGHGSRLGTVAGLSPDAMGLRLRQWFKGQDYSGAIRLVACHSAWEGTELLNDGTTNTVTQSYARRLAAWFGDHPSRTFRPASVQGLRQIGWVDPQTGVRLSVDTTEYCALSRDDQKRFTTGGVGGFNAVKGLETADGLTLGDHVHTGGAAKQTTAVNYHPIKNAFGFLKGTADDLLGKLF